MSVHLNIFCLVCISIHYTRNYAKFDKNAYFFKFLTRTRNKISSSDHLHTELVQAKFSIICAPFTLISIIFGSWLIAWFNVAVLSWVQQSISTRFSQSVSGNLWWYTIHCNAVHTECSTGFRSSLLESSFLVQWTLAHGSASKQQCRMNGCQCSVLLKQEVIYRQTVNVWQ